MNMWTKIMLLIIIINLEHDIETVKICIKWNLGWAALSFLIIFCCGYSKCMHT